jgi:tripartite-type tricarboxylate transporter receptor subunit TctC
MSMNRRHFLNGAAALPLAGLLPARVRAQQGWPNRLLRIVVPFTPGGSSDIIARLISQRLSELLKQNVVVENKVGANGNMGAAYVAQSKDDGHTVILTDVGAMAISPSVYTKLPFDPSSDLRTVTMLVYSPHVLAVHPSVPAKTLPELVALSKKQSLSFAVTAIGSAPHLAAVAIQEATGAKWEYIPYKGGSQAISDTVSGQTPVLMNGLLATLPQIRAGGLRAIGLSKRTRMSLLPDMPTIAEQGVPDFESGTWQGVMASTSLTAGNADTLAKVMAQVINEPNIKDQLTRQGAEVVTMTPAEMSKFFNSERARWAQVVKRANIRLD